MEFALQTKGFGKTYRGGLEALKPLDLEIPPGTCFGLLGPNGAGKSTLVKTLLSIVRPTVGSATLLGLDSRRPHARRSVGYLPEGHRFPRYLTGGGVCEYFGRLGGLSGSELKQEIDEKLGLVGMSEWKTTKISKYSKGMNQRVGLAQAMIGNPKLIFLDEPTDGVDPQGRRELRDVIKAAAERGTTIFFNSHLLSEVEVICDRIAILNKGVTITSGTVDEIKRQVSSKSEGISVDFRCGELTPGVKAALKDRAATFSASGFNLELQDQSQIDGIVDALRRDSVSIFSIKQQETNLEDAFISLIQDTGTGAQL
ncbi:MAG: ABC transporter ATP-binding protein [Planctomycetota bacterium]